MSLFDLVINIIESSIMCYFIYKYFDFKNIEKLWLFILIDFTSITLCNYFINESSILLIVVISVLVACLKIFGEKIEDNWAKGPRSARADTRLSAVCHDREHARNEWIVLVCFAVLTGCDNRHCCCRQK